MTEPRFTHRRGMKQLSKLFHLFGATQAVRVLAAYALKSRAVRVRVRGYDRPVHVRIGESDISVLWQVYGKRELDVSIDPPVRVILDLGANVGYATRWFMDHWPEAKVIAVEPSATNAASLRLNNPDTSRLSVLEAAIGSRDGHCRIVNPTDPAWALRVGDCGPGDDGALPMKRLGTILAEGGFDSADIVKIDIEGAEVDLLNDPDAVALLGRSRCVIIETHGEEAERLVGEAVERFGMDTEQRGEKFIAFRR